MISIHSLHKIVFFPSFFFFYIKIHSSTPTTSPTPTNYSNKQPRGLSETQLRKSKGLSTTHCRLTTPTPYSRGVSPSQMPRPRPPNMQKPEQPKQTTIRHTHPTHLHQHSPKETLSPQNHTSTPSSTNTPNIQYKPLPNLATNKASRQKVRKNSNHLCSCINHHRLSYSAPSHICLLYTSSLVWFLSLVLV